jgi:hypothetical protein
MAGSQKVQAETYRLFRNDSQTLNSGEPWVMNGHLSFSDTACVLAIAQFSESDSAVGIDRLVSYDGSYSIFLSRERI